MVTLLLQNAVTIAFLLFGGMAIVVGRLIRADGDARWFTWSLAGVAFTLHGLNKAAQNVFGNLAFFAGKGTDIYASYLEWLSEMNHSRTSALVFFMAVLLFAVLRRYRPGRRFWIVFSVLYVLSLGVGVLIGFNEAGFRESRHYMLVASLDTVELLLLFVLLFVMLVTDRVDRLFWFSLALYGFTLALNILWTSALTGIRFTWAPSAWHMHAYRLVVTAAMAGVAWRRLSLARRGVPVPSLLSPVSASRSSSLR